MCDFAGTTIILMEKHILDNHVNKNRNDKYSCDECTSEFDTKDHLWDHFQSEHKRENPRTTRSVNIKQTNGEEVSKLNGELKLLKNNFKRLEGILKDTMDEAEKTKSQYEAQLMQADEVIRVTKAENEVLKERLDVVYKLGRSYLNRFEGLDKANKISAKSSHDISRDTSESRSGNGNEIELLNDVEEVTDSSDTQQNVNPWAKSKLRGFVRNNRSESPETSVRQNSIHEASNNRVNERRNSASEQNSRKRTDSNVAYCHYFSNYGRCLYEESSKNKCRFEHKVNAPLCKSGTSCNRHKCMYKHPTSATGNSSFLGSNSNIMFSIPPWQVVPQTQWWGSIPGQGQLQPQQNPWSQQRLHNGSH